MQEPPSNQGISTNPAEQLRLAIALHQQGQLGQAQAVYEQILRINPGHAGALHLLGLIAYQQGQLGAALDLLGRAIAANPGNAEFHANRGIALRKLKRLDAAVVDFGKAIAINPEFAEAYYNRGITLREMKKREEAMADLDKAIALKPGFAEAYNDRGNALQELQKLEAAIADYDKAIAIKLRYAEAYYNRGVALREMRQLDAAIADYDKAIALKPDYVSAYWNKALTSLLLGDLATGFELYEWRWKNPNLNMEPRHFTRPLWLGEEPLRGKRILLHTEQGLGDTIQFCRYVSLLARAGAQVILAAPRVLAGLLKSLDGVSEILSEGEPVPDVDYHCPLMSLPLAFKTTVGTIPDLTPYLHADPAKMQDWHERIGDRAKLRLGVVWSGGARPNPSDAWDERRNIRLDMFARALSAIDADFFSLQKGDPAKSEIRNRELEYWPRGNFHNFAGAITDFSDTAALIANLDLVITVDTSTAHLAGALGKPTWILNRFDTCWRWLLDRNDSPWYRSVKLYRQDESRIWEPVLRRVATDLATLANRHRAGLEP